MSIEIAIICDGCGRLIDAGKSAKKVRDGILRSFEGSRVATPGGKDYCSATCAATREIGEQR